MRTLFIFRQDLRVLDNTGLRHAVQDSSEVIPVFIFDTSILENFPLNDARVGFLIDALKHLEKELTKKGGQLLIFTGDSKKIIPQLIEKLGCDAVYANRSYGAQSLQRDIFLKEYCATSGVIFKDFSDYLLVEPQDVPQRKVFTPFYKLWMEVPKFCGLLTPDQIPGKEFTQQILDEQIFPSLEKGQSSKAYLELQKHASKNLYWPVELGQQIVTGLTTSTYDDMRNFPAQNGTSKVSPYVRFGLISIRQLFRKALKQAQLNGASGIHYDSETHLVTMDRKVFKDSYVSELAWREFWQHIHHYFPDTRVMPFQQKRSFIEWENNPEHLEAWKNGKTGYPFVDAGMRQLKEEKRMHGRVRMVVASFLTKDLLIDWRYGEEHFKDHLLDYDMNVNIGNRQRSASVGADPKPLRIFNPILQSKRFDPQAEYIKKRVPEVAGQEVKAIHDPISFDLDYIPPIVDHYVRSKKAKTAYAASAEKFQGITSGGDIPKV